MLTLLSVLFAAKIAATSSIKATIRGTNEPLDVTLLQRDTTAWREIARRPLPASRRRIDFDGLAAGVYQIRVQRSGGGEQAAARVIVGSGQKQSAEIDIDPIEIFGRATMGDVPLAKSAIVLKHRDLQYQVAVLTGDDGLFHGRLWQRGSFIYSVRSPALATAYSDFVDIDGRLPFRWELRLPDRRIAGTVRDRVSGAAVPGAMLYVETRSAQSKRHQNAQAGSDGRFVLDAMRPGVVTISAGRDGYLDGTSAPITLNESDRARDVAIALEPGTAIPMVITDAAGRPLADAAVLAVLDGNVRSQVLTGSDGRARVTLPRDVAATLYAIPHDGSFAVVHVAKAGQAPRRITVPRASSSLRIVTRTTDGKPLPNVELLMRVNGELIPPVVAEELADLQGLALHTDEQGEALLRNLPAGSYEFWPYSGASEAEAIAETADSLLAPIVVNVKTGENTIAVNFRAR